MKKQMRRRTVLLASGGVLLFILGFAAAYCWNLRPILKDPDPTRQKLEEVYATIKQHSWYEPEEDALTAGLAKGLVNSLNDPYAQYYTEEEFLAFQNQFSGNLVGAGVTLQKKPLKLPVITNVTRDGPAEKGGLQKGDVLIKAAGIAVDEEENLDSIVRRIQGEPDTMVELTVFRPSTEEQLSVTLRRTKLEAQMVSGQMLNGETAYIGVAEFLENTGEQFVEVLDVLENAGAKALILDLRDNPGGSMDAALMIADRLLADTEQPYTGCFAQPAIIYDTNKQQDLTSYVCCDGKAFGGPVAILLNGDSASASELVSGALRAQGKALLLGERSFGKGIYQSMFPLSDGGAVKLTMGQYFIPNGFALHEVGLTPDVELSASGAAPTTDWDAERLLTDDWVKAAVSVLEECRAGQRALPPAEGADMTSAAPDGFLEKAAAAKCRIPHFDAAWPMAEQLLPALTADWGWGITGRTDRWVQTQEEKETGYTHQVEVFFAPKGARTGGSVDFEIDVADQQLHWINFKLYEGEEGTAQFVELAGQLRLLDAQQLAELAPALSALTEEDAQLDQTWGGTNLTAWVEDGELTIELWHK